MAVQEPFVRPGARRYPLAQIAKDAGAELCTDTFTWVESEFFLAHTKGGEQLPYDALLLAPGAGSYANFRDSITLDRHRLGEQLHGVLEDIEGGVVHKLGFVIPDGPVWPLPIYELALMTARRAPETSAEVEITIVTPERAPLAVFGHVVAERVQELLSSSGITTILSTHATVHGPGLIAMQPDHGRHVDPMRPGEEIHADRVIALPQLFGPHCPGVPTSSARGFISTDRFGRVHSRRCDRLLRQVRRHRRPAG
jgi:sulfide:quinone oxidoreductase